MLYPTSHETGGPLPRTVSSTVLTSLSDFTTTSCQYSIGPEALSGHVLPAGPTQLQAEVEAGSLGIAITVAKEQLWLSPLLNIR